jgi:hypothetical protein
MLTAAATGNSNTYTALKSKSNDLEKDGAWLPDFYWCKIQKREK